MGHSPRGHEVLDEAKALLAKATCARDILILQAVILPLENRLTIVGLRKLLGEILTGFQENAMLASSTQRCRKTSRENNPPESGHS